MKIGLIDVDSHNFPNLPLMKVSAWHKQQGHEVEAFFALNKYDCVYASKIFTDTPDYQMAIQADKIVHGGTGYNLSHPLPPRVESIYPDYSLYPQYKEAYGFLTRGCPRQCGFCIVSKKEGTQSVQVAELNNFWRGQRVIKLLDPNLLACKDREKLLEQLIDSKAWIDFTQGLDIRLMDEDCAALINKIKVKIIHFAWDNPREDLTGKLAWFKARTKLDERRLRVYVLTNYNSSHQEDMARIHALQRLGYDPYVMIYNKPSAPQITRYLQRWANNKQLYRIQPDFNKFDPKRA